MLANSQGCAGCAPHIHSRGGLLVIRDHASLMELLHRRSSVDAIHMALPPLTADENASWQLRLERAYFACGCDTGAVFGILTLVALVFLGVPHWLAQAHAVWLGIAAGFGVLVGAALVGKGLGILVSRIFVRHYVQRLSKPPRAS